MTDVQAVDTLTIHLGPVPDEQEEVITDLLAESLDLEDVSTYRMAELLMVAAHVTPNYHPEPTTVKRLLGTLRDLLPEEFVFEAEIHPLPRWYWLHDEGDPAPSLQSG